MARHTRALIGAAPEATTFRIAGEVRLRTTAANTCNASVSSWWSRPNGSAPLDDAELVHPDPLDDSDTNLHRDIRESSVLLRHVRGLER
jgi:hypothetical protein